MCVCVCLSVCLCLCLWVCGCVGVWVCMSECMYVYERIMQALSQLLEDPEVHVAQAAKEALTALRKGI
jgi:hypothetical protein